MELSEKQGRISPFKAMICLIGLGVFLTCLTQIRLYDPILGDLFEVRDAIVVGLPNGDPNAPSSIRTQPIDVIVDAGHGGGDGGTVGGTGGKVLEKDVALIIATALTRELRARGLRVLMTRESDVALSLDKRCRIANATEAKMFVSIHLNYSDDPSTAGIETFYSWPKSLSTVSSLKGRLGIGKGVTVRDNRGELLAATVQENLHAATGARDRGVKNRRFWVTRNTVMPSVLIECGFLSNRAERERLAGRSESYRKKVVAAIADGIGSYLEAEAGSELYGLELSK